MRLWTLHPKYLDAPGLVALWREALLARAVLRGETRGYRHHPQLDRFKLHQDPGSAINAYLAAVFVEAASRGYSFDPGKLGPVAAAVQIAATLGQVEFEWKHLMSKLLTRNRSIYEKWYRTAVREPHPFFVIRPGEVEPWERAR